MNPTLYQRLSIKGNEKTAHIESLCSHLPSKTNTSIKLINHLKIKRDPSMLHAHQISHCPTSILSFVFISRSLPIFWESELIFWMRKLNAFSEYSPLYLSYCTNPVIQFPGDQLISPSPTPHDEGRGMSKFSHENEIRFKEPSKLSG